MATYVIGDVQGCYDELIILLDLIEYRSDSDVLWFTGDLINRGPKSLKTLRFIKALPSSTVVVLGNHDMHLLAVAANIKPLRNKDTFGKILLAKDRIEILSWLQTRPLLHYDPHFQTVLLHAGLPPQWDLTTACALAKEVEEILQSKHAHELLKNMYGNEPDLWDPKLDGWDRYRYIINCLTRIRFCDKEGRLALDAKGAPASAPKELIPWYAHQARQTKNTQIVFGHWATLQGITDHKNAIAIDTGCVWGGSLTALRLDDGQRFSTPCRSYQEKEAGLPH